MEKLPVINLMGPTASGKTALAFELYQRANIELISVDSALIFRDMNIGTAKPTPAELKCYPHHLIDILDPTQVYSAAEFVADATRLIDEIHQRGKTPLLVGGTMLYFKSLLEGLADDLPAANAQVRADIEQRAAIEGWQVIYEELVRVDPIAGRKFNVSDKQRIIRALEVYYLTGTSISTLQAAQSSRLNTDYAFKNIAIVPERHMIHQRIELRLEKMWQEGFIDEVIDLTKKYTLTQDLPALRTVGYRQVFEYLQQGDYGQEHIKNMQLKALYATRQLAKRQYTWLRSLQQHHTISCYTTVQQAIQDLQFV